MFIEGLEVRRAAGEGAAGYAVIAAPHPLMGGSMHNPVVHALADGFGARGVGTLCFNYRGIGQSAGEASDSIARSSEDYARVLAWARAELASGAPLYAAGYSFGAITAIATALRDDPDAAPRLSALALVAPPLSMLDREADLAAVRCPSFVLAGEHDSFLPLAAARDRFASIASCQLITNEADHFFAYELDDVRTFASNVIAAPGTTVPP